MTECGHFPSTRRGSSHCSTPLLTYDLTSCTSATLHQAVPSFLCDSSVCLETLGRKSVLSLEDEQLLASYLYFLSSQLPHRWLESSYWLITLVLGCECVCVHVCICVGLRLLLRLAQSTFEGNSSFLSIIFYWRLLLESLTFCKWD